MRLLTVGNMYPPHHQGGYEVVWQGFVRFARAAGEDVSVLTTAHREAGVEADDEPGVRRELRWYWRDHEFPRLGLRERVSLERFNAGVLDRALRELQPDAVMWWAMGGMSLSLIGRAARAGVPAAGVVHDAWPAYGPRVDQWTATRAGRLMGGPLRVPAGFDPAAVGGWTFNSDFTRSVALAQPGWSGVATQVDHPGIEPARFAGVRAAGEWGWRLACVGRVEERKGLAHAVRALALLPEEASLTVTGGGDERHRGELEALAGALGVAARTVLAGPRPDVEGAYGAADAVVFPVTWDEPFGLVPLEAMAARRPVVATATGGAREYLRDGVNALVVAPGDPEAIADAVRRLAADAALRERLVAGGVATAARFTQERFDADVLELARRVAARSV